VALETRATHEEILEANGIGVDIEEYGCARGTGATHGQVLEVHRIAGDASYYSTARRAGATHAEVLDALKEGSTLEGYGRCRLAHSGDSSHTEIIAEHRLGRDLRVVAAAIAFNETYEQTLEVQDAGIDLDQYEDFRSSYGLSRDELLEGHRANPELLYYVSARQFGLTHGQAVLLVPYTTPPKWVLGNDYAPWNLAGDAVRRFPEGAELIASLATEGLTGNGSELAEIARKAMS